MKKILFCAFAMSFVMTSFAQGVDSSKTTGIILQDTKRISGKEPLIIIDGHKQLIRGNSAISEIDERNIESVHVIKGGAATSLYGTDGLDGVIEITTKDGSSTKLNRDKTMYPARPDSAIKGKFFTIPVRPPANVKSGDQVSKWLKENSHSNINGNAPLYIVDGVEVNDIKNINPDSIASVNILKDAAATALYAKKGKNGVVLITTKIKKDSKQN